MIAKVRQYTTNISNAASTIFEGMAVTLSYMVRTPMTVQYPDRMPKPITETLPERYRGFLEVDMGVCTACQACAKICPIECIAIEVAKHPEHKRIVTRFDIDMAKCMYCGLCTESCAGGAIRHTPEFEAGTGDLANLVFRFVEGDFVVPYKPVKGADPESEPVGEIARRMIRQWNVAGPDLPDVPARQAKTVIEQRAAEVKPKPAKPAAKDSAEKTDTPAAEAKPEADAEPPRETT